MNRSCAVVALLAVSAVLLSSCNGRTLLHGVRLRHSRIVSTAPAEQHPVTKALNVWFVRPDKGGLQAVCVKRKPLGADAVQQAVEELLDGPSATETNQGLGTEIPRGTILLGVKHKGSDVELNLSHRFAVDGGSSSFETRLDQLRRTVADAAGSANVYLNVEGKRLNIEEGEGIEIHQPINR